MKVVDLPTQTLQEAPWNPNRMGEAMLEKLRTSIKRYGIVENLVVRPVGKDGHEVLSGNQRLRVIRETGVTTVPCIVLNLDDAHACLLSQALNHIRGADDLGLRAELIRNAIEAIPEQDILALLPETAESLKTLASLGQETIASYLDRWQKAQAAKLKHIQFQLTTAQLEVVEEALSRLLPQASQLKGENPNTRGTALYLLCKAYIEEVTQQ